jgi:hypothetical protein
VHGVLKKLVVAAAYRGVKLSCTGYKVTSIRKKWSNGNAPGRLGVLLHLRKKQQ